MVPSPVPAAAVAVDILRKRKRPPLPGSITAGCGLCWAMPFSGDALAAFRAATEGRVTPADYHQLVL